MTNLEDMTREQLIGQIMYLRSKVSRLEEAADEIERLQKYIVQQHNYFTGNLVADVVVTTGTEYVDVQPDPNQRFGYWKR